MRKAGPEGMVTETLEIGSGGPGLRALVTRAVGLDAGASVRLRQLTDDVVDVFVTTPFEVVASRRVQGIASRDGAVVSAATLAEQQQELSQRYTTPPMLGRLIPRSSRPWKLCAARLPMPQ